MATIMIIVMLEMRCVEKMNEVIGIELSYALSCRFYFRLVKFTQQSQNKAEEHQHQCRRGEQSSPLPGADEPLPPFWPSTAQTP